MGMLMLWPHAMQENQSADAGGDLAGGPQGW